MVFGILDTNYYPRSDLIDSLASFLGAEMIIGHLMEPRVPDTPPSFFNLLAHSRPKKRLKNDG
jgi:hypothetical protein